jgi:UDP-glucuronate decarboxylase
MSNILITGGAGFIAGALAKRLASDPANRVVVVDNLITGDKRNLPSNENGNVVFLQADVNDEQWIRPLFEMYAFDTVFHYAALVGVQRTLKHPVAVLRDIDGIRNILNLSVQFGVKRLFYSSSSEVYGEPVQIPQHEHTTPLNSRLPYAIVKNLGEAFLRSYQQEFGLNYTIFRFFNTYGPGQSSDFVMSRFLNMARANEDITIYGDGSQTRTFCFIDDNLDATLRIYNEGHYVNDVVNIGSDIETTILELAQAMVELTGSSSQIVHLPALPEGDMTRRKPDITKMSGVLNRPLTGLREGMYKLIKHAEVCAE